MRPRVLPGFGLLCSLLGCGGVGVRPAVDPVARAMAGPVARGLVTSAPEAWVEVLREADRARGLSGLERVDAEVELALSLEWAQAVAERGVADRSTAAASAQRCALSEEQTRLDAEVARLEQAARASLAAHAQSERARSVASAPLAVESTRRIATADELDQQTELLLAAAELFGARPGLINPLRERLIPTRSVRSDRLADSATVYREAEALFELTRSSGDAVSTSDVDAMRLQASLAETEGVDAYRDARGVIAVLRGLFEGTHLAPTSRSRVELLERVIRSHGTLPVRIECFTGGPLPATAVLRSRAQALALRSALVARGIPADRLQSAGFHRLPGSARTEDRVEVVLLGSRAE